MSFSSFSNPYASAGSHSHDAQRQQHITELVSQVPSTAAKSHDRSVYEVSVSLRTGARGVVRISLPPGFPNERPQLTVVPPIPDPWADPTGRLVFDALRQWQHPQSRLVAVVSAAMSHLSAPAQPPPPQPPAPQHQHQQPAKLVVPQDFAALEQLSTEEVVKLLTDTKAYEDFLAEMIKLSGASEALKDATERNAKLAQRNLEMEEKFTEAKTHIAIVRSSEYGASKQAFDDRVARQAKAAKTLQPDKFMEALEQKGAELEEQSDDLYSQFLAEDVPVEQFVDQYLKLRTEVNERLHRRQAAQVGKLLWSAGL